MGHTPNENLLKIQSTQVQTHRNTNDVKKYSNFTKQAGPNKIIYLELDCLNI